MKKKLLAVLKYIVQFANKCAEDNISVFAGQASFFFTLSMVPFVMILISIAQFVVPFEMNDILRYLHPIVPLQFWDFVVSIIAEVFEKSTSIKVLSVTAVTALWSASRVFMALESGLDHVFSGAVERNYFIRRIIAVIYTAVFIAVMIATLVILVFGTKIQDNIGTRFTFFSVLLSSVIDLRHLFMLLILTLYFAFTYRVLPHHVKKPKHIWRGAFIAAAGWDVFSTVYGYYMNNFANFSRLYGSLGSIAFLMLWVYFCMNIFFLGAEFNERLAGKFIPTIKKIFKIVH